MRKTIVITGGASGIGAATISRLVKQHHDIICLDIHSPPFDDVQHIHCDLSSEASINQAVGLLPTTIDVLLNVAGVAQGNVPDEKVMAVNFLGLRHLTETTLPQIREGGRVVLVASSAGRDWRTNTESVEALLSTPDFVAGEVWLRQHLAQWQAEPYRFSKQCAAAYTYRAAGLARDRNITVNCVNPGIVDTQLSPHFRDMVGPSRYDWIIKKSGRAGTPEDISPIIEFLATGDCEWLNGVEITVDGGYFAGLDGRWINRAEMPDN